MANRWNADMTLGEAIDQIKYVEKTGGTACACCGPPPGYTQCFCWLVWDQTRALHRGAHITAKLLLSREYQMEMRRTLEDKE